MKRILQRSLLLLKLTFVAGFLRNAKITEQGFSRSSHDVDFPQHETISLTTREKYQKLKVYNNTIEDMVFESSRIFNNNFDELDENTATQGRSLQNSEKSLTFGRNYFWETLWPNFDIYKKTSVWDQTTPERPTFTKSHFVVLPIYWDGETPDTNFNLIATNTMLQQAAQFYFSMSWGKLNLTWEIWDRVVLPGVTKTNAEFTNSKQAAIAILNAKNYTKFLDYTGIILLYNNPASGPLTWMKGYAYVNGDFVWQNLNAGFHILRHEIGHNYGHFHHLINDYNWRFSRGSTEHSYDSFDFLSGGNGYWLSDIAAASKWYYNWIPNESIVIMQPEGSNYKCPQCVASVTDLVIRPFDDPSLSPSFRTKMAVQIPITATKESNRAFSYWLSYRGISVDGKASHGISVHVAWFDIYGGTYGASYDSLNYDVFGDTATKFDSFIIPGTCYVISPSGITMDVDPRSSIQIQPIVCVSDINKGKDITISVSFLNPDSPPNPVITPASTRKLECSSSGGISGKFSLDISGDKFHLLHFNNTGLDGNVTLSLCRDSLSSPPIIAYFYDSFPHSSISFGSPKGYGAYMKLYGTSICNTMESVNYATQHGEVYILVERDPSASELLSGLITVQHRCSLTGCSKNSYLTQDGSCNRCPLDSISPTSSSSIAACMSCAIDGMVVLDQRMSICVLPLKYNASLTTASEWRLVTTLANTANQMSWTLNEIKFYSSETCDSKSIVSVKSGTLTYAEYLVSKKWHPSNAFRNGRVAWSGQPDEKKLIWIGMNFPVNVTIKCISLNQQEPTSDIWIQTRTSNTLSWRNTWIESGLATGRVVIPVIA